MKRIGCDTGRRIILSQPCQLVERGHDHRANPAPEDILFIVFQSIFEVFLLCLAGFTLSAKGIVDKPTSKALNHINIFTPSESLLFSKVAFFLTPGMSVFLRRISTDTITSSQTASAMVIPIFFVVVTGPSGVVAHSLARACRLKRSQVNYATAASMFMNSNSLPATIMQSLTTVPILNWGPDDTCLVVRLLISSSLAHLAPAPTNLPGETPTVVITLLARMVVAPLIITPMIVLVSRLGWGGEVFEDPVFIVSSMLLVSSPPALTLAQISQRAKKSPTGTTTTGASAPADTTHATAFSPFERLLPNRLLVVPRPHTAHHDHVVACIQRAWWLFTAVSLLYHMAIDLLYRAGMNAGMHATTFVLPLCR
ncbi:hypothetical protein JVT61DRAFT_12332 [Boletus reticuloceps]|uniref:Uncharacterized protein n=1 Tax=Boletus reticuloceps TaxID=495285 RepID=A0A8I2YE43_9AGAM|nr:hypothetical protein JVT61DRAFT_12332 [Boletus reticuloceps]